MKQIFEKYYNKEEEYYSRYRYDDNDKEFQIDQEIVLHFKSLGIKQCKVSVEECYSSCGYDCDLLYCVWIDNNGELNTDYTLLECM